MAPPKLDSFPEISKRDFNTVKHILCKLYTSLSQHFQHNSVIFRPLICSCRSAEGDRITSIYVITIKCITYITCVCRYVDPSLLQLKQQDYIDTFIKLCIYILVPLTVDQAMYCRITEWLRDDGLKMMWKGTVVT